MQPGLPDCRRAFHFGDGRRGWLYSLPALEAAGLGGVSRLPVSLRILLESLLRHLGGPHVSETQVHALANWQPTGARTEEIPLIVTRILLQDFTGVPLLCDLAALRDTARRYGHPPELIEPLVPVDLVVDHSVQVDHFREVNSLDLNQRMEFHRNAERYRFIKWGMQAFRSLRVVAPGIGICHQVNLEYLARGVSRRDDLYFPDSLVGTDSHTTMINALGVLGWGVGGIEAEAGMLGQPIGILTPDVIGVHLTGRLRDGVTATDLVLLLTQRLRQAGVVGQFVEFFGSGAGTLSLPDRATLANMAPEYGATVGYFPPDQTTADYLRDTGRTAEEVDAFRSYFQAQQMFGMPAKGEIDYSRVVEMDLDRVEPGVAGPKRPQDHIALPDLGRRFVKLLNTPISEGGYGLRGAVARATIRAGERVALAHGDVLIAAITSCTNTSNPRLMMAAGLLAQRAVARGLQVRPHIKTSLAPGSQVVAEYLGRTGLLAPLEALGFRLVAYGCTTCIGNSGPLEPELEDSLRRRNLVCAAVLSGNRNFEARIHPAIRANFLMSPPLVVAFALAGRVDIDLSSDPLGHDRHGTPVFLHDLWPSTEDIDALMQGATTAETYRSHYAKARQGHPLWETMAVPTGDFYSWTPSTYIAKPPFLDDFSLQPSPLAPIHGARALAIFGDSITTDHISPAGSIAPDSPSGLYLSEAGVLVADFNSYGARRGHHEVMLRGTFANPRLRNLMMPRHDNGSDFEGGLTRLQPEGTLCSIYEAAVHYQSLGTPMLIFAGQEYGSGSSRDWAAKGTRLLGVRAVVARSFERIHRTNLVGMGVLPLQFIGEASAASIGVRGGESFEIPGIENGVTEGKLMTLRVTYADGHVADFPLRARIDTPLEADYFRHGGILPFVLRGLLNKETEPSVPSSAFPVHEL